MKIKYPVLTFSKSGHFWPSRDGTSLTQASEQRIRRGDFDGMTIIDADGRLLTVAGVKRVGYVPPFLGFRLFTARLKRIERELRDSTELSIQEIQDRVWRGIMKNKSFWESAWDQEELQRGLQSCPSVSAIVDLLVPEKR